MPPRRAWPRLSDASSSEPDSCVSSSKHEVEFCNNGVEGAQLSEHHPPRASLTHEATDWRHNAPLLFSLTPAACHVKIKAGEGKTRTEWGEKLFFIFYTSGSILWHPPPRTSATFPTLPGLDRVVNTLRGFMGSPEGCLSARRLDSGS